MKSQKFLKAKELQQLLESRRFHGTFGYMVWIRQLLCHHLTREELSRTTKTHTQVKVSPSLPIQPGGCTTVKLSPRVVGISGYLPHHRKSQA